MLLKGFQSGVLMLCAVGLAGAQTAVTPPPVKMGLWETTVTWQTTGMQLPPEVIERLKQMGRDIPGATPHTTVVHRCLTPAEWQKIMEPRNRPKNSSCEITKHDESSTKYSFDMSCKTPQGVNTTGHWVMDVVDSEHTHGSGHMVNDQPGPNGQNYSTTMTMDSKYLSADCGDVKPGDSKIVKQ